LRLFLLVSTGTGLAVAGARFPAMLRTLRIAALALLALVATGCVTMNVASHLDRNANFAQYRTWDWGPADALPTGDPRLDNSPFFKDYFEGAVEKAMAAHGFTRAAVGAVPDLQVHYHANINHRFEIQEMDREQAGYYDVPAQIVEYDQGTLVVDVVDANTKQVVWRGWAQDSVQGVIDNQARMRKQIDEAVTKMWRLFPRAMASPTF
jgi:hypothetical protein